VAHEVLVAAAASLSRAMGTLPAALQCRALWRYLRKEGTRTLTAVASDALDALDALEDAAQATAATAQVVPPVGEPLLLEVCALGCRRPASRAPRVAPRSPARRASRRFARSARWRRCA